MRAYIAVTAAYWAFMLTDGALRMMVLLHFHQLGFSALTLAWLFLLYEFAGVATNLCAGWLAARFGLTSTLYMGLGLQVVALVALSQVGAGWSIGLSVAFVMVVQGLSGVAKDLAKMSSKSAVKLLAPDTEGSLFRWVAWLTGSKNAVKGVGFFLGAAGLGVLGFAPTLWLMAAALAAILVAVLMFMPQGLPRGVKGVKFASVFAQDPRINRLSLARMFLFAARDVWFVVGIPVYFHQVLSDGSEDGARRAFFWVGSFMALWIIAYGGVQAVAPRLLRRAVDQPTRAAGHWVAGLSLIPLGLAALALWSAGPALWLTVSLVVGLLIFGFVFAVNSSLHSWLILAFTSRERVTRDVGFYYMANAGGRLLGTALSGISYTLGGLPLCLLTAALLALGSWLAVRCIPDGVQEA
ncbi:organoarsenical effux MFS transporter ArsJ [Rhodobacteraceae bacterium]|nr:organoarsenical effux MFS transporter ArsJ [Paracoccaceae bacterium]